LLHGLKALSVPHAILFNQGNIEKGKDLGDMLNKGPKQSTAGGRRPEVFFVRGQWDPGPWQRSSYYWYVLMTFLF